MAMTPTLTRTRSREIPLTAEQLAELDGAIHEARTSGVSEPPNCYFAMCYVYEIGVQGLALEDDFIDIQGDVVRLVRPSLEQLLEARRRAVLKH